MRKDFQSWLEDEKGFKPTSARDVVSRLSRVESILGQQIKTSSSLDRLARDNQFQSVPKNVQSQLRRACALYLEFQGR